MTKNEIAAVLEEIGMLLELEGENPFKTRAYQSGARALEAMEGAILAAEEEKGRLEALLSDSSLYVDTPDKVAEVSEDAG